VTAEQVPVELDRLGPQIGPFLDPGRRVLRERHASGVGVDPVLVADLGFLEGQPDLGIGLAREGAVGRAH